MRDKGKQVRKQTDASISGGRGDAGEDTRGQAGLRELQEVLLKTSEQPPLFSCMPLDSSR